MISVLDARIDLAARGQNVRVPGGVFCGGCGNSGILKVAAILSNERGESRATMLGRVTGVGLQGCTDE
jgi:hypothetical protein